MSFKQKNLTKKNPILNRKKISIIAILAMADVLVMAVPFYLKNIISSVEISTQLGVTPSQFSQANSIYGYVALLSYFIGGYFADRISLKKLTFWGLLSVGVISIWYGFLPFLENGTGKVAQLYIIFSLWSFVTCFIFWAALWKLLSQQGTADENGILNGVHGSLNGLIGSILIGIAYLIFYLFSSTDVWGNILGQWAFSTLVFIFTGFTILNCFLLWKFVPENKAVEDKADTFDFHTFSKTLKNYKLWLVTLLIMGVYMYQSGLSVFVAYMNDALLITSVVVVIAGILRTYLFRFLFSVPAGKLADKTQKYIFFIIIGLFIASIITMIAIFLPGFDASSRGTNMVVKVFIIIFYLLLGITCWALVTNRWATIYEINISQKEYAMSVGFISFIAFSPDAWFWQIDSILLDRLKVAEVLTNGEIIYNYKTANQVSLGIIVIIGLLAALGGIILLMSIKREKNKIKIN